jgi:hypothetical protein
MKIVWENIEFNEHELMEMIKKQSFDTDDMPSTLFQGPFSVESVLDPMSFSKRHRPIIGHCDFNISSRRSLAIMKTEGVDFFRVITRYSFIFSAGKAFNEEGVKDKIEAVLGLDDQGHNVVAELQESLSMSGRYCIYIRDGETHTVSEDNPNFDSMVAVYKESQKKFGGQIYEG